MIRPFDWRDFPALHHQRHRGLYLDMSLELTRSTTLVPVGALLSYFASAAGIYTYVAANHDQPSQKIIAQFAYTQDAPYAQLAFLTPESAITSAQALALLDHLAHQAGKQGAHYLLAEVNDRSLAFDVLRKAGYAIYTRQRIWKAPPLTNLQPNHQTSWQPTKDHDINSIRQLYASLVPALVHQIEPPPWNHLNGLVCYQDDELIGYVRLITGPNGILAHPILHPKIEAVSDHLHEILQQIPNRRNLPIYFVVRSHQAWLELYLTEMHAEPCSYQAVMLKRLAVPQKIAFPLRLPNPGLESPQPEAPAATFSLFGNEIHYDPTKNN